MWCSSGESSNVRYVWPGAKRQSMSERRDKTPMGPPVPELPVADVELAQAHYRDTLAFEVGWLESGKEIGAVSRDRAVIFLRRREPPFEPVVHWMFSEDIEASYREARAFGANIVDELAKKPWGLRQFTVKDMDGNLFYFHDGGETAHPEGG
jgi:predicted enzyme related to lactoylglutathione lyase